MILPGKPVRVAAPTLDALINDQRLARLFADRDSACALQLWILQVDSDGVIENRLVYGRLLPHSHASNRWSASDRDTFESTDGVRSQVVRLNLYHAATHSADLVRRLSQGCTLHEVTRDLGFDLPDALEKRFGSTALPGGGLSFRPVSYVLNRDAVVRAAPMSPHASAGALSASVSRLDKTDLLRHAGGFSRALARQVFRRLKEDTGMDFRGGYSARLGDLECLVFPSMDEHERDLLHVERTAAPGLRVRFAPKQVPALTHFHVRLCITNDREVVYTAIAPARSSDDGHVACEFILDPQVDAIADSAEVEVFGGPDDSDQTATLCCRWAAHYVREMDIRGSVLSPTAPIRFAWLERTTRGVPPERVAKALTLKRGDGVLNSRVGSRTSDPWVPARRELDALVRRLDPPKSAGGFFPRWGCSKGEGRLRFLEWLQSVLAAYPRHEFALFDPYFDASGLGVLLLGRTTAASVLVFTSLPKPPVAGAPDRAGRDRVPHLVAGCKHNEHLFGHQFQLRVYGLKDGWLHDRYLLVTDADGIPAAGYHLSNSLQKASENFPLLVTPIPPDTLIEVEAYKRDLLQQACASSSSPEADGPMTLLYDSTSAAPAAPGDQRLAVLHHGNAGDVLGAWLDDDTLNGTAGDALVDRLDALGLIRDGSLSLADVGGLKECLARDDDFSALEAKWTTIGDLFAHSVAGDGSFESLAEQTRFLAFLKRYLESSLTRTSAGTDKRGPTLAPSVFTDTLDEWLYSGQRGEAFHHPTRYAALTWPEYYAIRILWACAPGHLLDALEGRIRTWDASQPGDVALALLSQAVSEIALSLMIGTGDAQRERLLESPVGVFQWMGLQALEQGMRDDALELGASSPWLSHQTHAKRTQIFGWMVQRAARDAQRTGRYRQLVAGLLEHLPDRLSADHVADLVNALRGHMRTLSWAEPWLYDDIVGPLLDSERVRPGDAGDIWVRELLGLLAPQNPRRPFLFNLAREGRTTQIAAGLVAHSDGDRQAAHLRSVRTLLNQQRRIIQQPLASTTNWALWANALAISLWILGFLQWLDRYLRVLGRPLTGLDDAICEARAAAERGRGHRAVSGLHHDLLEFVELAEHVDAASREPPRP